MKRSLALLAGLFALSAHADDSGRSKAWAAGFDAFVVKGAPERFKTMKEIARHLLCRGRKQRIVDPRHFDGVAMVRLDSSSDRHVPGLRAETGGELLRPLSDYEAVVGGQE